MGCNRKRLAGSLTAGPLDKKKDEETPFNKNSQALPGCDLPTGTARDESRRGRAGTGGEEWRWWQKEREEESERMEKKANRTRERFEI